MMIRGRLYVTSLYRSIFGANFSLWVDFSGFSGFFYIDFKFSFSKKADPWVRLRRVRDRACKSASMTSLIAKNI